MEIECNCGQKIEVPDDFTGRTVVCPRCKVEVEIEVFPRPKERLKSAVEYVAVSGPPKCPSCGKLIQDGELTCSFCGARIPEAIKPHVERPEERALRPGHEEIAFLRLLKNVFTSPLVTMEAFTDYFSYPVTILKVMAFYVVSLLLVALYGSYVAETGQVRYTIEIHLAASLAATLGISVLIHLTTVYFDTERSFLRTFLMVAFISGIINVLIAFPLLVYAILWLFRVSLEQRQLLLGYLRFLLYPVKIMFLTMALSRMQRFDVFFSFVIALLAVLLEGIIFGLLIIGLVVGLKGQSWSDAIIEHMI